MKKRLGIFRLRGGAGPRRIEVDWDRDEPTETAAAESSDEDTDSVDEVSLWSKRIWLISDPLCSRMKTKRVIHWNPSWTTSWK